MNASTYEPGTLYGIGTGPGDPELMTLKAVRHLRDCPVVAYFTKRGGNGNAFRTASEHIGREQEKLPLVYPVTTEIPHGCPQYLDLIERFFDDSAAEVAGHLECGRSVAVLSEGDPFFYGSFMHVFLRLQGRFPSCVVPGVPAMLAGSALLPRPITMRDDVMTVIPGTLPDGDMLAALKGADAAVIMKVGRNLPRIRQALRALGLEERAWYIERASMAAEKLLPFIEAPEDAAPYFSMVLIPGHGERR